MAGFHGIDVGRAAVLGQVLRAWPWRVDDLAALIFEAEHQADIPTGVHGALDEIAESGLRMALAIERAADTIQRHRLEIKIFGSGLGGLAPAGPTRWSDGPPVSWSPARPPATGAAEVDRIVGEIARHRGTALELETKQGRLEGLVAEIVGDPTPGAHTSVLTLLARGVPAQDVFQHFSAGHDAGFGDVAEAMRQGLSPAQANLHPGFFPIDYVRWHNEADEQRRLGREIEVRELASQALGDDRIDDPAIRSVLHRVAEYLPPDLPERAGLLLFLDGQDGTRLQQHRMRQLVAAVLENEREARQADLEQSRQQQGSLTIPTLHRVAGLDERGALTTFDAIGAAAATVPVEPSTFIGAAYGAHATEFTLDELGAALGYAADDSEAAAPLFATLGPTAAAVLLTSLAIAAQRSGGAGDASSLDDLTLKMSRALGHASRVLPGEYGEQLVQTRPEGVGVVVYPIEPEVLFVHGDFEPDFLVEAAAVSVVAAERSTLFDLRPDPRPLILERVADQNLGGALVNQLEANGTLDSLVWPAVSLERAATGHGVDPPGDSDRRLPLASELLVQAGRDTRAADALIESAGSRLGDLDLATANGLSHVLASRVADHLDAPSNAAYFDATQNVFAAGAGVDIDAAMHQVVVRDLAHGLRLQTEGWWSELGFGRFAAEVDARKYVVFEDDAAARDAAIANTAAWISTLSNAASVGIGITGIVTGGTSLAVAGLIATGSGWVGPMLLDEPENLEEFYRGQVVRALSLDRRGEALAMLAALEAGAIVLPAGAELSLVTGHDDTAVIRFIDRAGEATDVSPNADSDWTATLVDELNGAGAQITLSPNLTNIGLQTYLDIVSEAAFGNSYVPAFEQATGLVASE